MDDRVIEKFYRFSVGVDPLQRGKLRGPLVSQQQRRQRADGHCGGAAAGRFCHFAPAAGDVEGKALVVPFQEGIGYAERDAAVCFAAETVFLQEHPCVDEASHDVGTDRLLDLAVFEAEGDRFAEIVVAAHLAHHRLMRADVFPQPLARFHIEIDHLLDIHDIVFDEIDHVTARQVVVPVIDGDGGVVLVPFPVFVPGEVVAEEAAMRLLCELRVQIHEVGVLPGDTPDVSRRLDVFGQLHVPNAV